MGRLASLLLLLGLAWTASAGVSREAKNPLQMSTDSLISYYQERANSPKERAAMCDVCRIFVDGLQVMIKGNKTDEDIEKFATELCISLHIEQPYVCKGIVKIYAPEITFVLQRVGVTPDEICGSFIKNCGTPQGLQNMWDLIVPQDGKPDVKPYQVPPTGKPTYRVLHLSDIHIDRQYTVGSEAYCQLDELLNTYALCCRNYPDSETGASGAKKIQVPAGEWGMPYTCDLPYKTFDSALKHIAKTEKNLAYILITGDLEAHDMWDYTEELTTSNVENITNALLKYFPNTPVYFSIGNHEGVPADNMGPHTMPEYETRGPQWLYSLMKESWSHWIPKGTATTVQYRASYSVIAKPGLKLISINTVYCSDVNFYLYLDQRDPDATLEWLMEELQRSEDAGETVHIISHIPPGAGYCLMGWSWNFYKVIKRYESTISEMFYGHTHQDHFQVYYDFDDPNLRPFANNWISPSITTYSWNNPSYRIYEIDGGYDGATYHVVNAETYYGDVEEANASNKEPAWKLMYDTKKTYNMTDFSPASWDKLANRLLDDEQLFKTFMTNYYRRDHDHTCYKERPCRAKYVCEMKQSRSHDETLCKDLQ